ncbi:MAG: SGNH/GDSL hydrolase family protein [Planctomycetaceae bacterium]
MQTATHANETRRRDIGRFMVVLAELLLIAGVVHMFGIERQRYFLPVLCACIAGFAVQAWLPLATRGLFFALLSIVAIPAYLGLADGGLVLVTGGALIGTCLLPIGHRWRVGLLLLFTIALICLRTQFPRPFWPVLGSMFMFRLIVFVYERRHAGARPPLAETLTYFFMLPNVCFPLFPVVNFREYCGSHFNDEDYAVYQRGVFWIVQGLGHLVLYRFIKANLLPAPESQSDIPGVVAFMVTNYALYLQVSGQFHIIIGMLHLFGFNLPRTHDRYFLASSFTDIWRRINIYWKDFMMKFFFFPAFHASRRRGATLAMAIALAVGWVFVATWVLHSWQTFWLRGSFPLTLNDACLWLAAGTCVAVNAVREAARSPAARLPDSIWRRAVSRALRIVGMFLLVGLFWGLWTDKGFSERLALAFTRSDMSRGVVTVLAWLSAVVAVLTVAFVASLSRTTVGNETRSLSFAQSAQLCTAVLALVLVVVSPWFAMAIDENVAASIARLKSGDEPQNLGQRLLGYYENLNEADIQAGPLMTAMQPAEKAPRAFGFDLVSRPADIYQEVALIPGVQVELNVKPFSVNKYGLRDRADLVLAKPPNTVRIALLGSSIVMGYGVADNETFARLLEQDLNAAGQPGRHYEVLNFGVGKQWAAQRLARLQRQVFRFSPDSVFYFAHQDETTSLAGYMAKLYAAGQSYPSPHIAEVVNQAGVKPGMTQGMVQMQLHLHQQELLRAVYRTIVDECRAHSAVPLFINLPIFPTAETDVSQVVLTLATQAGFVVCDLSNWSEGRLPEDAYSPVDQIHPDSRGHRMIADALRKLIQSRPEILSRETSKAK